MGEITIQKIKLIWDNKILSFITFIFVILFSESFTYKHFSADYYSFHACFQSH